MITNKNVIIPYDRVIKATKLSGKYAKRSLYALEALHVLTPDIRKIVLDNFADFARDIGLLLLADSVE